MTSIYFNKEASSNQICPVNIDQNRKIQKYVNLQNYKV
jgi:hypothetical protein